VLLNLINLLSRRWSGVFGEPPDPNTARYDVGDLEPFVGPFRMPQHRRDAYRVFGNPGVGKVDPRWERANMIVARDLPGDWNAGKNRLYIHKLAEPHLREALRVCDLYGVIGDIETIGCFNFRHQRHDPARPLSYHSFGIAVDINPMFNRPIGQEIGPAPFTEKWMEIWPEGVSRELVAAFKHAGWSWGGKWKSFIDPMHFELIAR